MTGIETELLKILPKQSVEELDAFPYATHQEFLDALQAGRVKVGTMYDPNAFNALATPAQRVFHVILTSSGLLIGVVIAVIGVFRAEYLLLLGLPISVLGLVLSGHYCAIGALMPVFLGFAAYYWTLGNTTAAGLLFLFIVSRFLPSAARGQCNRVLITGAVRSEIVLVWLVLKHAISIREAGT